MKRFASLTVAAIVAFAFSLTAFAGEGKECPKDKQASCCAKGSKDAAKCEAKKSVEKTAAKAPEKGSDKVAERKAN